MGVRLIEGRLPENDSEVIIPQMMTTAGKEFHVGDTITWQIGERIGSDGRVIQHQEQRIEDRSSADFCEEETIQVEQTKTYTIVGVSTNPGYQKFAEPCYLVLTTGVQTTISDIYLKRKALMIPATLLQKILAITSQRSMRRFCVILGKVSPISAICYWVCVQC